MREVVVALSTNATGGNTIELLYYLIGILGAIIVIAGSIRSIVVKMIERSREEAVEKAVANEAMKDNTKAIEKLTQKFEQFTTAITTRVDDAHNRIVKIEDKLERLITNDK